jgi:hypothetical protein
MTDSGDTSIQRQENLTGHESGAYYYGVDRSYEQYLFLRSIETEVSEALVMLKNTVLPLFAAAKRQGIEGPGYEAQTWSAIWTWANQYSLIEPGDVERLNTPHTMNVARRMDRDYMFRWAPTDIEPFKSDSTAIVFGLSTLIRVVLRTLEAWSASSDLVELRWWYPALDPTIYDKISAEELASYTCGILEDEQLNEMIQKGLLKTPDPPPFIYTFTVQAWSLRREDRDKATNRILEDLKIQLREQMDRHEDTARLMGLEKCPRIINTRHFDWLALYQVKGWNQATIARHVKKSWEAKGTSAEHLAQTVRSGIKDAAELVVGWSWRSWRRPGKAGRPPKPRP